MSGEEELEQLRQRIAGIDEQLLRLVGERLKTSREVAETKRRLSLPIRNFRVEVDVLARARKAAEQHDFDPELARRLMRELIEASVETQREHTVRAAPERAHRRILVVGGGGRMGSWLCQFFAAQGHQVRVSDPASGPAGLEQVPLARGVGEADVVAVSTPLGSTPQVLRQVLDAGGNPLVFDICSLKGELIGTLREAARQGRCVTSLHPMFA
ncbi:MAG: chorismate mutase, partial [Candidatus Eremiobacterota bacterium]